MLLLLLLTRLLNRALDCKCTIPNNNDTQIYKVVIFSVHVKKKLNQEEKKWPNRRCVW